MTSEIRAASALIRYNAQTPTYWPTTTSRARKFSSAKKPINTKTSSRLVDTKTTIARPIKARNESIYTEICQGIVASKMRGYQMPGYLMGYTECRLGLSEARIDAPAPATMQARDQSNAGNIDPVCAAKVSDRATQ